MPERKDGWKTSVSLRKDSSRGYRLKTSALERRADEAEQETDKMKKVQYMEQFIGEEFEGVISGVTNWGFYVELPNTVEGWCISMSCATITIFR